MGSMYLITRESHDSDYSRGAIRTVAACFRPLRVKGDPDEPVTRNSEVDDGFTEVEGVDFRYRVFRVSARKESGSAWSRNKARQISKIALKVSRTWPTQRR